jgi:Histidine kinase-, DNA gyrase B-, and HSP90-like ATPase
MPGWPYDRPGNDLHEADMPHEINTKSTWPWTLERGSAQADHGMSALRNEFEPGTRLPAHGGPDGAFEVRTLRELCHDLTVPATSIRLLASVAAKESDPDPSLKVRLRQIADEAGRIADICSYFLDPARKPGPTDLRLLAVDAADSARSRFSGAVDVVADPATVTAHPVDVARILANLLDNACRAAGPTGRVRLAVQREGGRVRLVVADSGRGFGHGEFGQASLGLGIVAALVRRNDGAVQMSTGDLGGLAVTVTLPEAGRPVASDTLPEAGRPMASDTFPEVGWPVATDLPEAFPAQRSAAGRGRDEDRHL